MFFKDTLIAQQPCRTEKYSSASKVISPQIAKVAYSIPLLSRKIWQWHQDSKTQFYVNLLFAISFHVFL